MEAYQFIKFQNIFLESDSSASDFVTIITLNRPDISNAFNADLIRELTRALTYLSESEFCRALVLRGSGKNFCAGADLNWMKHSASLSLDENRADAQKLMDMFEALANLNCVTIAYAHGAVFGGGVGLVAACDYAFCAPDTDFCLSEAKLGLAPAVIAPYVGRKMGYGHFKRLALTAKKFSAAEAEKCGLVQSVVRESEISSFLLAELAQIVACGAKAQSSIKALLDNLKTQGWKQSENTADLIARLRTGLEGQDGLQSFFNKKSPSWSQKIPSGTRLEWQ